jgi:hypothetical protein
LFTDSSQAAVSCVGFQLPEWKPGYYNSRTTYSCCLCEPSIGS